MNRREALISSTAALALSGCAEAAPAAAPFPMRRGVNLGNALEAPQEGEWGYRIEAAHLQALAAAGFDGVRLPVRWDAHAGMRAPYPIEAGFLRRVSEVVEAALGLGLQVQLNAHHYEAVNANPAGERSRFLGIWRQIAGHFRGAPAGLYFEPLNEPNGEALSGRALTALQQAALSAIRETHGERLVIFGGPNWSSIDGLFDWRPPTGERIAASVHYYEPHGFTHFGAEWLPQPETPPDRASSWGDAAERARMAQHAQRAAAWARARGLSLQLGEFGVNRALSLAQRANWTRACRRNFEALGVGWCVWDFAGAFPIWDEARGAFFPEMLSALME
ncbi:MAG: glycoside hydrolase family 5 protein [Hyphomonadaceae bacterium]